MSKFELANIGRKTIFRSRTILTIALTVLAFAGTKFLGMDSFDWKGVVDATDGLQVQEIIALVGLVVAGYFRKNAKVDLGTPGPN